MLFIRGGGSAFSRSTVLRAANNVSNCYYNRAIVNHLFFSTAASQEEEEYDDDNENDDEVEEESTRHVERGILFSAPCLDPRTHEAITSVDIGNSSVISDGEHVEQSHHDGTEEEEEEIKDECVAMNSDKEPGILFSVPRIPTEEMQDDDGDDPNTSK